MESVEIDIEETESELLRYLWEPKLAPMFWPLARTGAGSAWLGHVPFAHWIVAAASPRVIVELGTHNGVSYSCFCEAVQRLGLDTRCYAVDKWTGDEHSGYYGEDVYYDICRFNKTHYSAFSELLRCTFDEALRYIADRSVDILHIDGLHTYEAVRHDFENWWPKLSERAVVLFHDTNVREREFGVWRFWEEIAKRYPNFEFLHGHGLGVLVPGGGGSPEVLALCRLRDPNKIGAVRERFALLGERWITSQDIIELAAATAAPEASGISEAPSASETVTVSGVTKREGGDQRCDDDPHRQDNTWDDVYEVWKQYRRNNITRSDAIKVIDQEYGLGMFLMLYPANKIIRPLRKIKNKIREMNNKLIMTLLVRDEVDIVKHNIEFHLKNGVDYIIATDNGSIDGTRDVLVEYQKSGVLHLIDEKNQDYSQAIWVNRMGDMAVHKYGADILFHCDADEFWSPKSGSLKRDILRSNADVLVINVINVLLEYKDYSEKFPEDSLFAVVKPLLTSNLEEDSKNENMYLFQYPPKVMFKTQKGTLAVSQGNHDIVSQNMNGTSIIKENTNNIRIYHFPVRNKNQFFSKVANGGRSYENNKTLHASIGFHWRRWYEYYKNGILDGEYRKLILDRDNAERLISDGMIEHFDFNEIS